MQVRKKLPYFAFRQIVLCERKGLLESRKIEKETREEIKIRGITYRKSENAKDIIGRI